MSVLFQPFSLAAGSRDTKVIAGAVLSIFTDGDVKSALLPATSVTLTDAVDRRALSGQRQRTGDRRRRDARQRIGGDERQLRRRCGSSRWHSPAAAARW